MIDSEEGNTKLKAIREKLGSVGETGGRICNGTGCTANVVLITKDKYVVANAGDSRSALSRNGTTVELS